MQPKFNIDRPKVSDDEINKNKNFDKLVKQFKEQSLNKAKSDKSWWKNKTIKYAAVIAGVTVICTVTYQALFNNKKTIANDKIITKTEKTNAPTVTKFINEPFNKLKVNSTTYKVNSAKGADIKHPSNSKIKIPKNSFVNNKGEEITGDVEIVYREFHDQADIIASGIPMVYDSAGYKFNFESAGMFEIKGYQNGELVFIKPNSSLTVEFNSNQPKDNFNQYYLDTVAKNWRYIKRDNPVISSQQQLPSKPSDALKTIEQKYEPAIAAIPKRIDSVNVVYKNKINKLDKPVVPAKPNKAAGRPQFELEVDYKEFPELAAFKNALFEIGTENTNYSDKLTNITWSSADISEGTKKGVNYLLTLKLNSRIEKLIVYPVLSGTDYETAAKKYEDKFEKYKILQEKRIAQEAKLKQEMAEKQAAYLALQTKLKEDYIKERNRIQKQAMDNLNNQIKTNGFTGVVSRVFSISNFGIFNSDCPHAAPNGKVVTPIFVLNENNNRILPTLMYLIETNRNIVISYNQSSLSRFTIEPSVPYSICLISGSDVYTVNKDEFAKAILSNNNTFKIQKLNDDILDVYELKKAMGIGS